MKVGETTGSSTSRAAAAPWTKRVLPAPRSPVSPTTSPGRSRPARAAPIALVVASSGERRRRASMRSKEPELRGVRRVLLPLVPLAARRVGGGGAGRRGGAGGGGP